MTKLSLDAEPPSKFEGKKEARKKGNENLPRLIVFLRNKNKIVTTSKNLEKKVIADGQKNILNIDYIKNEEIYAENNLTLTNNSIEFTSSNTNSNKAMLNSYCTQKEKDMEFSKKDIPNFYEASLSYSFIPHIREEKKKEDLASKYREQENKEISYAIYNFDEEIPSEN